MKCEKNTAKYFVQNSDNVLVVYSNSTNDNRQEVLGIYNPDEIPTEWEKLATEFLDNPENKNKTIYLLRVASREYNFTKWLFSEVEEADNGKCEFNLLDNNLVKSEILGMIPYDISINLRQEWVVEENDIQTYEEFSDFCRAYVHSHYKNIYNEQSH